MVAVQYLGPPKLLVRLLKETSQEDGLRLAGLTGGDADNAIPREASALVCVPESKTDGFLDRVIEFEGIFQQELAAVEPDLKVEAAPTDSPAQVMEETAQRTLINILYATPQGVMRMSDAVPGLVETSTNFAIIETTKGMVRIDTSQRSSVETQKANAARVVGAVGRLAGASVTHPSEYPGWQPRMDSAILKTCRDIYKTMFKKEPRIEAIHAGLECGIIGEKCRGMDMVSLGPTIHNVHSPDESVEIKSVEKSWKYLLTILEKLA